MSHNYKGRCEVTKTDYRSAEQHVTLLGWLYIGLNILLVFIAALVFAIVFGSGLISGDAEAVGITFIVGISVAAFLTLLAVPGIVAGVGLVKRKSWARVLALILGVLNLLNFPFGTALGIYTIWALMPEHSAELFGQSKLA